jgi:hypothetical protein
LKRGDILPAYDLSAQVDLHREKCAAVRLHLVEVDDPARCGCGVSGPALW